MMNRIVLACNVSLQAAVGASKADYGDCAVPLSDSDMAGLSPLARECILAGRPIADIGPWPTAIIPAGPALDRADRLSVIASEPGRAITALEARALVWDEARQAKRAQVRADESEAAALLDIPPEYASEDVRAALHSLYQKLSGDVSSRIGKWLDAHRTAIAQREAAEKAPHIAAFLATKADDVLDAAGEFLAVPCDNPTPSEFVLRALLGTTNQKDELSRLDRHKHPPVGPDARGPNYLMASRIWCGWYPARPGAHWDVAQHARMLDAEQGRRREAANEARLASIAAARIALVRAHGTASQVARAEAGRMSESDLIDLVRTKQLAAMGDVKMLPLPYTPIEKADVGAAYGNEEGSEPACDFHAEPYGGPLTDDQWETFLSIGRAYSAQNRAGLRPATVDILEHKADLERLDKWSEKAVRRLGVRVRVELPEADLMVQREYAL